MRKLSFFAIGIVMLAFLSLKPIEKKEPAKVVFAVIDNGAMIEPVARLVDGKLVPALSDEDEGMKMPVFAEQYYKPGTIYKLIGGGKSVGKTTVVKNDPGGECTAAMAEVTASSASLKLKGFEMALATDIGSSKPASGTRRAATAAEKAAIDKLVSAEFRKNYITVNKLKQVKLTVLDADNDKVNEIVGTYTVEPAAKERAMMFFIATRTSKGGYELNYSEFQTIKEEYVMSGDITSVDDGIYQEMLLDVLDTDNSGISKIFTMTLSFEGAEFNIYQRKGSKWEKELSVNNYHCAY